MRREIKGSKGNGWLKLSYQIDLPDNFGSYRNEFLVRHLVYYLKKAMAKLDLPKFLPLIIKWELYMLRVKRKAVKGSVLFSLKWMPDEQIVRDEEQQIGGFLSRIE